MNWGNKNASMHFPVHTGTGLGYRCSGIEQCMYMPIAETMAMDGRMGRPVRIDLRFHITARGLRMQALGVLAKAPIHLR